MRYDTDAIRQAAKTWLADRAVEWRQAVQRQQEEDGGKGGGGGERGGGVIGSEVSGIGGDERERDASFGRDFQGRQGPVIDYDSSQASPAINPRIFYVPSYR